jgi:CRP/FNR family cyclic AMP-dependent transcriptional regulator
MAKDKRRRNTFDPKALLTGRGVGQSREHFAAGQTVYLQGGPTDAMFFVESGYVKIASVSPNGKEAVVAIRGQGEFFGTRCLVGKRMATATALTVCSLIRVTTSALIRLLREGPDFAVMFATYLVGQSIQDQESLVDHLTNPAEKRLARALLQLAGRGDEADPQPISAPINQAVLANMVGTTRSRVSYFMNNFKRRGLIDYDRQGRVSVRNSLRKTMLDD